MALTDQDGFQTAIFTAITTALANAGETMPVYDHVPETIPVEHIRIGGLDVDFYPVKDGERGRHSLIVSFFRRQVGGAVTTMGQGRIHEVLNIIHADLDGLRYSRGRLRFEYSNVDDDREEKTMHGFLRYTIVI